jgi:predicted 3-demethylubiquinone-9 3-methyltransferase (glyoxalase superfamily)
LLRECHALWRRPGGPRGHRATCRVLIAGPQFMCIDGTAKHDFTPAMSRFVQCETGRGDRSPPHGAP